MNQFSNLKEKVSELNMHYEPVVLKLGITNAGFLYFERKDGSQVYFDGFTRDGLTYLFYRIDHANKALLDRKTLRYRYLVQWKQRKSLQGLHLFVDEINNARMAQTMSEKRRTETEELIAAFEVKNGKHLLAGLLTNYNPTSHEKVIEMIESANLENAVTAFQATNKELKVFFKGKEIQGCDWKWGLVLYNGRTGHRTLGYGLYVNFGVDSPFVPDVPFVDRKRHLSTIVEFEDNLEDVLEKTLVLNVDMIMQNMLGKEFEHQIMTSKAISEDYKSLFIVRSFAKQPIIRFYSSLVKDTSIKGKKTAAKKAVEFVTTLIFNKAMEN